MTNLKSPAAVLALNSGSSSLKFGLYRVGHADSEVILAGAAEAIGESRSKFSVQDADGRQLVGEELSIAGHEQAMARIGELLAARKAPDPVAIGHRVVHGGAQLRRHCLIDAAVLRQLETATAFAPLHAPPALAIIRIAGQLFPRLPHAACLDTAFHAELPDVARILPIPREMKSAGVRRYGFHGLSCESVLRQLGGDLPDRLVIAHLGNGASVTAVKGGRSVDTSMGLTPSGGVIMGTRCGDLDPGVLSYLVREKHFDAARLEDFVDHRSGLLGISGISGDMRRLHETAASQPDAQLAIDMFCYSVRKQVAAMTAALDGIDLLVFTGGIGEHDAQVRANICGGLSWLGIGLDSARNGSPDKPISTSGSRCQVRVLPARENEQIARHAWRLAAGVG
jgi:acetate kinase